MKMGFLLKNNARRGGRREKEAGKGRGKEGRKRPPKFANSKTDGRLGGNSQILKAEETQQQMQAARPERAEAPSPGHRPG